MPKVLRDHGLSSLLDGELEILAQGFQFTEGPLWLPDGRLLFQDLKASRTWQWQAGQARSLREDTRGANGQTLERSGSIVFCEQDGRRISRMNPDGTGLQEIVESYQGKRLNSPNDLVVRWDGKLLFTDPAYGVPRQEDKELPFQGLFQYDLDLGGLSLITSEGFEKPNGLALAPDHNTLFVNDTGKYHVRKLSFRCSNVDEMKPNPVFELLDDQVFATFNPDEPGGPDGIKIDVQGRLYVAVAQGIWVLEPDGRLIGILATPKRPSNLAWGEPDGQSLFITAVDQVLRIRMKVAGVLPVATSTQALD